MIAGALAFLEAARKARPVLLEPIMDVSVTVPTEFEPRLSDSLRARGANVSGLSEDHEKGTGAVTLWTSVPLSQMLGFGAELRHRTQGRGTCSIQFSHYAPVTLADDDSDRDATVTAPRRPRTPSPVLRAAVPEPLDDSDSADLPPSWISRRGGSPA